MPSAAVVITLLPDGRPSEMNTRLVVDGAAGATAAGSPEGAGAGAAGGADVFEAGVAEQASAQLDASATASERFGTMAAECSLRGEWQPASGSTGPAKYLGARIAHCAMLRAL